MLMRRGVQRAVLVPLVWAVMGSAWGQVALTPTAGAKEVCSDMPLRLTFSAPPALGTGVIEIRGVEDDAAVDTITVNPPARAGRASVPGAGTAPTTVAGGVGGANPSFLPLPTRGRTIGGTAGFVYYPILISGNEVAIYPDHPLPYGKAFYVKIPPGAFTVGGATLPTGVADGKAWQFTTKARPPELGDSPRKITVAADGSGDFCTVQAAIDWVPAGNTVPTTVFIKRGTYNEIISFSGKNKLTLLGEDRQKTIIAYANNSNFSASQPQIPATGAARGTAGGGYRRGLFSAQRCQDLTVANLTLHNTTRQGGSQAEAIILSGTPDAHAILANVDLFSFQDTLQINGQAYVSDCYIEGDVDFMWGTGPCFFENCHVTSLRDKGYYTQIRNTPANHGYVYHKCVFDGKAGVKDNFLARIDPQVYPASEVVLLDCVVGPSVGSQAWQFDRNATAPTDRIHFWEYNSHDAKGKPVDTAGRYAASRRLTQEADAETIKNYGDATWVLGGQWTPTLPPNITHQP